MPLQVFTLVPGGGNHTESRSGSTTAYVAERFSLGLTPPPDKDLIVKSIAVTPANGTVTVVRLPNGHAIAPHDGEDDDDSGHENTQMHEYNGIPGNIVPSAGEKTTTVSVVYEPSQVVTGIVQGECRPVGRYTVCAKSVSWADAPVIDSMLTENSVSRSGISGPLIAYNSENGRCTVDCDDGSPLHVRLMHALVDLRDHADKYVDVHGATIADGVYGIHTPLWCGDVCHQALVAEPVTQEDTIGNKAFHRGVVRNASDVWASSAVDYPMLDLPDECDRSSVIMQRLGIVPVVYTDTHVSGDGTEDIIVVEFHHASMLGPDFRSTLTDNDIKPVGIRRISLEITDAEYQDRMASAQDNAGRCDVVLAMLHDIATDARASIKPNADAPVIELELAYKTTAGVKADVTVDVEYAPRVQSVSVSALVPKFVAGVSASAKEYMEQLADDEMFTAIKSMVLAVAKSPEEIQAGGDDSDSDSDSNESGGSDSESDYDSASVAIRP